MAESKKVEREPLYIRAIRGLGRVTETILIPTSRWVTMISGVAIILGMGLGADMITGSHITGFQPTWDDLKDWVHNNLANNPSE